MEGYLSFDYNPKESIDDDILCRKELVDAICNLINKTDLSTSLTIGITGKWGSGKTTVINFLRNKLKENKINVIDYNPWRYPSQDDLACQFLELLSYQISSNGMKKWRRFVKRIWKVTDAATAAYPDPFLSKLISSFSEMLKHGSDGIPLEEVKKSISSKMKNNKTKYAIFIDDLDRLDEDEIRMVMKLVRSIADFSNIVYILCYDESIVERALRTESYDGRHYIQKIINITIPLPENNRNIYLNVLADGYLKITQKHTWSDYDRSILNNLNGNLTLREVNLILARFQLLFNVSERNTCPADLLAMCYIQTMDTETYNWISKNRYKLCGHYIPSIDIIRSQDRRTIEDDYKDEGQNQVYVDLISTMFPYFKHYSNNNSKEEYRINYLLYVDNYFMLTPSALTISDDDVVKFIKCGPNELYNIIQSNDYNHISELIIRTCKKIECSSKYLEQAMMKVDVCLKQPFGDDRSIEIKYARCFSLLVETCLKTMESIEKKVDYLKSRCPEQDVHKILFFGTIVDRICLIENDKTSSKEPIFEIVCKRLSSNPELATITDPVEFQELIILLFRFDENIAKLKFTELMPKIENRRVLYQKLIDKNYDVSFLTDLVNDEPVPINHYD